MYKVFRVPNLQPPCWGMLLLLTLLPNLALGQGQPNPGTPNDKLTRIDFNKKVQILARRPPDPVPNKKLDRMIELPEIPAYAGKTEFISGRQLDGDTSTSWQLRFYAKEEANDVCKWYYDALSMYNWKMLDHSDLSCTARSKSGGRATIMVNSVDHNGMASLVTIMYRHPNS